MVRDLGSTHNMYDVPAFKDTTQVSRGRGKGGLVTLWRKSLTKYVTKVECNNFRIQATKFSFPTSHLLVINAYFPCDPRVDSFDDTDILTLLADLRTIIEVSGCHNVMIAADMNCDFVRKTRFTDIVEEFLTDCGLITLWDCSDKNLGNCDISVDYTYMMESNNSVFFSTIDHFACSNSLLKTVIEAGVIHSGQNTSNHSPIYSKIAVEQLDHTIELEICPNMISWNKASNEAKVNYKEVLRSYLGAIHVPESLSCLDIHCKGHKSEIDKYTMNVLESIENASVYCLPSTKPNPKRRKDIVPGWTELVKPYADENKFWQSVWLSEGKPSWGYSYECMLNSKRQYKYAIRRLKRCNDRIQNDKYLADKYLT